MCPARRSMFGVTSKIWTERGADGSYQSHYNIASMQRFDGILGIRAHTFCHRHSGSQYRHPYNCYKPSQLGAEWHNQPKLGDCVRFKLGFIWFRNNYLLFIALVHCTRIFANSFAAAAAAAQMLCARELCRSASVHIGQIIQLTDLRTIGEAAFCVLFCN